MTQLPVTVEDPSSITLLVVEDDDGIAGLLEQVFAQNPDYAATVARVRTLQDALERVASGAPDAVLLDLGLPDSEGLVTARRMVEAVEPPTAVVVFTALRDQGMASQALSLGVQDYVVKEDMTSPLVTRVVRYGVTRAQLVHELELARQGEARERELRRLERMALDQRSTTSVSAAMLGDRSVADRLGPERYDAELVDEYRRIIQRSLEEQAYRGQETVDSDLRSLAAVLGFLGAGPRDVIDLHTRSMRGLVEHEDPALVSGAVEEGRVIVLQLMGRLASYYRDRSVGGPRGDRTPSTGDKDRS